MRLYFAGMETAYGYNYDQFIPTDNLFCTYFYKRNTEKWLAKFGKDHKGLVTIDSGAHSFFSFIGLSVSADKSQSKGEMPDPQEYFEGYIKWIKEWYDYADYFVELDLQDIVGQDVVWEWRQRYVDEGIAEKIITVHHSMNTWAEYDRLINDSKSQYVALEGLRNGKENIPYLKLIKHAFKHKTRVHGFALTNQSVMTKYPFFSVDSSSWTATNRYGVIYRFDETKGRMKQLKTNKNHFFDNNLDLMMHNQHREKENQHFKLHQSQVEFRKMENYFGKLWRKRGVDWDAILD